MAGGNRWGFNNGANVKRPRLNIPLSRTEKWLRAISATGVLASIVLTAFGLLDIPLLAISMAAFIFVEIISSFPQHFNYLTPVTEENAESQYLNARKLIAWLCVETIGFILAVSALNLMAKGDMPDYIIIITAILLFIATGIVFLGTVLAYFVRLSTRGANNRKRQ